MYSLRVKGGKFEEKMTLTLEQRIVTHTHLSLETATTDTIYKQKDSFLYYLFIYFNLICKCVIFIYFRYYAAFTAVFWYCFYLFVLFYLLWGIHAKCHCIVSVLTINLIHSLLPQPVSGIYRCLEDIWLIVLLCSFLV